MNQHAIKHHDAGSANKVRPTTAVLCMSETIALQITRERGPDTVGIAITRSYGQRFDRIEVPPALPSWSEAQARDWWRFIHETARTRLKPGGQLVFVTKHP